MTNGFTFVRHLILKLKLENESYIFYYRGNLMVVNIYGTSSIIILNNYSVIHKHLIENYNELISELSEQPDVPWYKEDIEYLLVKSKTTMRTKKVLRVFGIYK